MGLNKLISMFKVIEEDDDDIDDDFMEIERKPKRAEAEPRTERASAERPERAPRAPRQERTQDNIERPTRTTSTSQSRPTAERTTDYRRETRQPRPERERPSKVVPIKNSSNGHEVIVVKPTSFEDSQDVCDLLISGKAVVANLEGFDSTEAQRIMDFISGCVYAMNGNLHQISKYIFIFSPESIDISGDFLDSVSAQGFGVPRINREF